VPPTLAFFTAADYAVTTTRARAGSPLFIAATAPACALNPSEVDSVLFQLSSPATGDLESAFAVETAPNSGRFALPMGLPTEARAIGAPGDGTLAVVRNDVVIAALDGCGALRTEARAWVDPAGVAFEARGGTAVGGARVTLIDVTGVGNGGAPGAAASVRAADGVTPAPSAVISGADGRFEFAWLPASTYRLEVEAPDGFAFPSATPPAGLASGFGVDIDGSYGRSFAIAADGMPIAFDLPLDATNRAALYVEKSASPSHVELGDVVDFEARIANLTDSTLAAVTLLDSLPAGFSYVAGSARGGGAVWPDPAGGGGPRLTFALGDLPAAGRVALRYRVRVGAGGEARVATNRAYATSGAVRSNTASAEVTVHGGVFAGEAMVLGSIFIDDDDDRRYDAGETPIPGVRLYLDDGTFAITDGDGRYTLYGVSPKTHALKVDPGTLPAGAQLVALDHRDFDRPGLRFVDATRGELVRADFACAADTALRRKSRERREDPRLLARGIADAGEAVSLLVPAGASSDERARPAAGLLESDAPLPLFGDAAFGAPSQAAAAFSAATAPGSSGPPAPAVPGSNAASPPPPPPDDLERVLLASDAALGFLGLADGDTLLTAQIAVRAKAPLGGALTLAVNGQPLPASRLGRRATLAARGVEAWEWVGVALRAGRNELTLTERDSAGAMRAQTLIRLVAPDRAGRLELRLVRGTPADGRSRASVSARVLDARGVPVAARTLLTLETTLGVWQETDLEPAAPGLQIAVEGSEGVFALLAPAEPGIAEVRARGAGLEASLQVAFAPELRPLLAAGTLEGTLALSRFPRRGANAARRPLAGFEARPERFVSESRNGDAAAALAGSFFVKGRVGSDLLLTIGYDSDRPDDLRRLRDIQPNAFYPTYGDGSRRGYEAQSTSALYARLDRRGAALLYGDYVTRLGGGERSLAAYSRSLNGGSGFVEGRRGRLDAFTSRDRARQRVEEMRGRGVSGPYEVPGAPFVENSERVEIVTRDRNQPAVVRRVTPRARFTEYEIDPWTGSLLFRSPVPSTDEEGHPVYVRVSVEVAGTGTPYWVNGIEGRVRVAPRLEVGGTYVDDHDPAAARQLRAARAFYRLPGGTAIETELAATRRGGTSGTAARLDLRHQDGTTDAQLFGAITGVGFDNPTSSVASGRDEVGARLTTRLDARARLRGEAIYSASADDEDRTIGALLAYDYTLRPYLLGEVGARLSDTRRRNQPAEPGVAALRLRLSAQLPSRPEVSGYLEAEQDVRRFDRHLAALGGEFRFHTRGRAYARHEFLSSFRGPFSLQSGERRHATVLGIDAGLTPEARLFGEVRDAERFETREMEAVLGVRNAWRMKSGARVHASFERVQPLSESGAGTSAALAGAVESPDGRPYRTSGRLEIRRSSSATSFLTTVAGSMRLGRAWTGLARNALSISDESGPSESLRDRLQAGVAYRPGGAWDGIARYELLYDHGRITAGAPEDRLAHVLSLHGTGRLGREWGVTAAWAGKRARTAAAGVATGTGSQWVHGRVTRDFGRMWDAGVAASGFFAGVGAELGAGVELGRQIPGGMWLSLGFNRFGYADDELTGEEYTRDGLYLRLRAKFDERAILGTLR
jgi:uncharacterized repeat protein (TIGR01451 family)